MTTPASGPRSPTLSGARQSAMRPECGPTGYRATVEIDATTMRTAPHVWVRWGRVDGVTDDDRTAPLVAACSPWAFTQQHPLTTSELCREAAKRGIAIKELQLRELWRVGALAPLVEVRNRRIHPPSPSPIPEPFPHGTWISELRKARDSGRLADAAALGYRPQLRFTRPASTPLDRNWWNGLLYSRWQLIGLHDVRGLLQRGTWRRRGDDVVWRSPELSEWEQPKRVLARELTTALVALEAPYLPRIERGVIHLTNAQAEEWEAFIEQFDPAQALASIGWQPDDLLRTADNLLLPLRRSDPLMREWSELVRRAPQRTWDDLQGDALAAMDKRVAAEILLRCYEDLAEGGVVEALETRTGVFHCERERISFRGAPLDANLSALGISPHPGVVFVVEGETEEVIVPRVRDHIRIPDEAQVIRSIVLRGVGHDLTKLAAFACAPMIDRPERDGWLLVKPPTYLVVVADPDPPFDTPESVEAQRQKIIHEMVAVVRAQGVDPDRGDLESLVEVSTWHESCFEFEHFSDAELANALLSVHADCNGLDRKRLEEALAEQRKHSQDIKNVWRNWRNPPSKRALAESLWPCLRDRLDVAAADSTTEPPPIALRLVDAFRQAMHRPRGRFVLGGELWPIRDDESDR